MGTRRRQLISDSEVCRRYRDGEPREMIARRAGLLDPELLGLLKRNGVSLRTPAETRALAAASRMRHIGTLRLKA